MVGSVIDSVLGATLQFSGYDIRRRKVTGEPGEHVAPIAGVPLLSNNAVNLISATVTAVLCGAASVRVFA